MKAIPAQRVQMIDIDRITVVNPRIRNQRLFDDITNNIAEIGLKRPITVALRSNGDRQHYDLVCGQGRLEAYRALGQEAVPAFVVTANQEDCLVASLVENCARRQLRAIDLLQDIGGMKKRGYSVAEIAKKTGLSGEYVYAVIRLLENGEERLLRSVETGQIPFSVALEIAEADDQGVQAALQSAYENNLLRGRKLLAAKRLVELRRRRGKGLSTNDSRDKAMSSDALVRAYEQEAARKRMLIKRAEKAGGRLIVVTEALRRLLQDNSFRSLLIEEGLGTIPEALSKRLAEGRGAS